LCVLSSLCLKRRRRRQCAIVFFCDGVAKKKKTTAMRHHFLMWCCWTKKGDGNKLTSPSSLCIKRRRKGRHGNAPSFSSMVVF
jgi:hypothetical protein